YCFVFFFFFQAEDGIRDRNVTGVQTCALPILICVLIQGSKGVPSSLSQVIYSSIGISGYIPFSDGRTGATIFLKLLLTANSFIFLTIRLLKPLPLNSG